MILNCDVALRLSDSSQNDKYPSGQYQQEEKLIFY
jgi:hypothetical protein